MGLNSGGCYARVWEVEDMGKYKRCRVSVSKKDKETGKYVTEFSALGVRFVGRANDLIESMGAAPFTVKITSFDVTTNYNKEKNKEYTNYVVWGAESAETGNRQAVKKPDYEESAEYEEEDPLPF